MKVDSSREHSVRPLSSTEGSASGIAGPEGSGQEVAAEETAAEIDETCDEEVAARDPKIARRAIMPTKAMILAHELHHADYRDWCDHCRAGKGVLDQHKTSVTESDGAEFSVDYAVMTNEGHV